MTTDNRQLKQVWNAAITLANNLCVQISDRHNGDDQIIEADTASDCAKKIREFIDDFTPLEEIGIVVLQPSQPQEPINPSMQCSVCGQWKRLTGKDGMQNFYPCCGENGEHEHLKNVCTVCCTYQCPYRKAQPSQPQQAAEGQIPEDKQKVLWNEFYVNSTATEVLTPVHVFVSGLNKGYSLAQRLLAERDNRIKNLEAALLQITEWRLPETGEYWDEEKTRPISYEAAYGSNGVRSYMIYVAEQALK